jgi:UDP-galactopyranose mutase
MDYDYLIVGSGLFGTTFARLATDLGKKCLIIESRNHMGGNVYSERREDIDVHVYGPHVFHCNDDDIWAYVNRFAKFNNFIASPKAFNNGRYYSLPFNMNTFYELWGTLTPQQARAEIEKQKLRLDREPENLEEQALVSVGHDVYEKLIRHYTAKQWMTDPKNLPAFIIKRLPVRFTYDNNYFNDRYQGIPIGGFGTMIKHMLDGIQVRTGVNYFENKDYWDSLATKVVFTGKIDEYFGYEFGELEYRTLEFEHEIYNVENYQGVAVVNFTGPDVPWTRMIEHKHFDNTQKTKHTIITKETPAVWNKGKIPYYPINDEKNQAIYNKYREKSSLIPNVIFGGRLAEYRYYDMHQVIGSAMARFEREMRN